MNLQTTYLGLSLAHPVIAGASPLSATFDGIRRLEDAGAAAIVAASIYEEEVAAEAAALEAFATVGAESHAEVTSYLPPLPGYPAPGRPSRDHPARGRQRLGAADRQPERDHA